MSDEKPSGALAKYGSRLLGNGYRILPIARGTKQPPGRLGNWRKVKATPELLEDWLSNGDARSGVGIDARVTPAVDLDILDEAGVEHMLAWIREHITTDAPQRIGQAPKTLLLFRSDDAFPKIMSRNWLDDWCTELAKDGGIKPYRVEILGAGQQFVAFAQHPDTKQPYRWVENGSPATRKRRDLPAITQEQAQSICDEFDRYAREDRGWDLKQGSHSISRLQGLSKAAEGDVFAQDKQKIEISEDDLERKLMLVPGAADYDTWVQIGMALYHQYDGEDRGLELWHQWSEGAENYDSDVLNDKWATFNADGKYQEALTARIIVKLAQEREKEVKEEEFRDIMNEIATIETMSDFKRVCETAKHIEFAMLERIQIVTAIQKRYKRLNDTTLPVTTARAMVRYEQPMVESPKWLEGWIYVEQDDTFYSITHRRVLSRTAFGASFDRNMLTKTDILEGKSVPEIRAVEFALNNQQIEVVANRMYLPGQDDLFWYNARRYANSYDPKSVPGTPDKLTGKERTAIRRVEQHFEHLFGASDDWKVLLDAVTWIVQNPGERLDWAILMQGTEGDGKSFFSGLLAAVLGGQNIHNLSANAMEEKFNGWAENAQVVFFEEIRLHGHNRYDVLNKVKPLITNTMVTIRRMQTDYYEVVNTASYVLTTNFRDALPVTENDTRYFILFSRFQTKAALDEFAREHPFYYDDLYEALGYPGALRKWLLERELGSDFRPHGRAPLSRAKNQMVQYSQSDEEEAFREAVRKSRRLDCSTTLASTTAVSEEMSDRGVSAPYGRRLAALFLTAGFTRIGKVRVGKETTVFWTTKPQQFMRGDDLPNTGAIHAYLENGDL